MSVNNSRKKNPVIAWHRTPLDRDTLRAMNERSDWKGALQTLGYLGLLALSGTASWIAFKRAPLWVFLPILFMHGTFYAFLTNGFHELCHRTVFKTKILNELFLRVVSFLGWSNFVKFWTSHTEHHKFTLHPPADMEVVLPMQLSLKGYLKSAVVNLPALRDKPRAALRMSFGKLEGEWEKALFPESDPERRRQLFNWARTLVIGHTLLVAVSIYFGLWLIPVLVTLAPFYGGWLFFLCNNTQHAGLRDNVPDFRLCSRTFILNPFVRFLYWHMNYHIEHHMFAAAPCYNLGRLHKAIKHDLPPCNVGLIATWKEIGSIIEKQKADPSYQFTQDIPAPSEN